MIVYRKNIIYTVGVKSMSPVDIELLFVILYNITALHHNTNLFFFRNQIILTSSYIILVLSVCNLSFEISCTLFLSIHFSTDAA